MFVSAIAVFCACGARTTAPAVPPPPLALVFPHPGPGERIAGGSVFGTDVIGLPDGTALTADAAPNSRLYDLDPHVASAPGLRSANAVATALSPDGRTLLVLTAGYNRVFDASGARIDDASQEHVFVYDVSAGAPRETQVVAVPSSFVGLAFSPDGSRFFVSGGPDDLVREMVREATGRWSELRAPVALGHADERGFGGLGVKQGPWAAGIGVSASGAKLVVADHENDAVTLVDAEGRARVADVPLSPGGEFPLGVAMVGESRAFVTSERAGEVVEVDVDARRVVRRIAVGAQPGAIVANRAGTRLYVANAGSDTVSVVDIAAGRDVATIPTAAPPETVAPSLRALRGASPDALALSPDERTLYVANGGSSTLAVVSLDAARVVGLVPTGFYPTSVAVSRDGRWIYVAHAKSPAGPNPHGPWADAERARERPYGPNGGNEFSLQLLRGGLLAFPRPSDADLAKLTAQSLANARLDRAPAVPPVFARLRGVVKHVVFVVSENRTYDQLFGDLAGADGDARLVHWGERVTPNHHAIARTFVTLDRFFATGGVSGDGWQWTMAGRTSDVAEKAIPIEYADRGHHTYDWEGMNRGVNVGLATDDERLAFNPHTPRGLLPGAIDVGAPGAFLWDAAIAAKKSVRVYGAFCDYTRYDLSEADAARVAPLRMPAETNTRVAFPANASLQAIEDPFFRCFDMRFADAWRAKEWQREFEGYVARGDLPALEIVRLPRDHLGHFGDALDGVDTPDTQMADHDWAVGTIVESVARSRYWKDTIVVAVEDDAQNGADHVDAHRTIALFAGAHVKRGAVVHAPYTTPSVLRTIEVLLDLPALGSHDGAAPPIEEVFDEREDARGYEAIVPDVLRSTKLPLPAAKEGQRAQAPRRDGAWWAAATAGFDFDRVDAAPAAALNRTLWCGLVDESGCATTKVEMASRAVDDDD